jgi:hypothetical protein
VNEMSFFAFYVICFNTDEPDELFIGIPEQCKGTMFFSGSDTNRHQLLSLIV